MHSNVALVVDITEFSKFVHEMIYACSRCSDFLGKYLLTNFNYRWIQFPPLVKTCQEDEESRETPLTRIEQLIDEIRFNADASV
jgi:hypothetical protein